MEEKYRNFNFICKDDVTKSFKFKILENDFEMEKFISLMEKAKEKAIERGSEMGVIYDSFGNLYVEDINKTISDYQFMFPFFYEESKKVNEESKKVNEESKKVNFIIEIHDDVEKNMKR